MRCIRIANIKLLSRNVEKDEIQDIKNASLFGCISNCFAGFNLLQKHSINVAAFVVAYQPFGHVAIENLRFVSNHQAQNIVKRNHAG